MTTNAKLTGAALLLSLTATSIGQMSSGDVLPDVRMDVDAARSNFLQTNPQTMFNVRDEIITRVYGKSFSHGVNPVDAATNFIADHANMFGIEAGELLPIGPNSMGIHALPLGHDKLTGTDRFTLVSWTQALDGIPVYSGSVRVLVRNEADFPVVLVSNEMADMRSYDGRFAGVGLTPTQLNPRTYTRHVANQFFMKPVVSGVEQVIWAGTPGAWVDPVLAVTFVATGGTNIDPSTYQKYRYVVDAGNGRILHQENMILDFDASGTVSARVTQNDGSDICEEEELEPLPHARIEANGEVYYTDSEGNFLIEDATDTLTTTSSINGKWFQINDLFDDEISSLTVDIGEGDDPYDFEHNASNANEYDRAEVNAYLWANRTRDWAVSHFPNFPQISTDLSWPVNINLSASCNAFYDFSSINHYTSGGGCPNTAYSDIIAHEYGHHMVAVCGSGQGQYGEGAGDTNALILTGDPTLGNGFLGDCETGIRSADNNYQYPCSGGVHDCGQLLSACILDMMEELGGPMDPVAKEVTGYCWVNSICLHTGTQITPDITIDFMTIDDNDNNIFNGTPNYYAINEGFSAHNMPGPDLGLLDIQIVGGAPGSVPPAGISLDVTIEDIIAEFEPGTGLIVYRTVSNSDPDPEYNSAALSSNGGNSYTGVLPAASCGDNFEFYIQATTTSGIEVTLPQNAPTNHFTAPVATGFEVAVDLDFEVDPGWEITGVSGASSGEWAIGTPCGTSRRGAPATDFDGSGQCYLTGPGDCDSNTDVDNGCTTMTTGMFSALNSETGEGDAAITYAVWYDNTGGDTVGSDPGNDIMTVDISTDGGDTWVNVETLGPDGARAIGGWYVTSLQVSTYGMPSNECMMRFSVCDAEAPSIIEAAGDAFSVEVVLCGGCEAAESNGDINADGQVDGTDLNLLLGYWETDFAAADLNCDGIVDGGDLTIVLGFWD